jgi:Domain of unknown function (DUF4349)
MRSFISCCVCRSAGPIRRVVLLCVVTMSTAAVIGCSDEMRTARHASQSLELATPTHELKQLGLAIHNYDGSGGQGTTKTQSPAVARKIIYDAKIDLIVESLNGLEPSILDLVKQNGGFLAESDLATQVSTQRTATWRVRVPVDRFDAFVGQVSRLGEVRTSHLGSQDVTEEFYDIEARIRNKQEEEKRLLKHLADSTGKLEDILKVEAELSRVRGEIEQMQGRLRFLANRADLSTVTITATELKDYTPPQPVTVAARIQTTFFGSLDALAAFGTSLLLIVIALVPWLPLIAIGLWVVYRMYRTSLRAQVRLLSQEAATGTGGSWMAADQNPAK